ncbi:MAG: conjugal transfer protein TraG N-terminal domain-containing protein, partial [Betaproteobacteria bacterium AqS2]|nr:conjugal transfer protein TraG N-terminal domain-containing protein [Betaproteobacteria bacterium AqS2]
MDFEYVAWGAGEMIVQALRALALIGGSGALRGALLAAALLGLLLLAVSAAFSQRTEAALAPVKMVVAVALAAGVLLQPVRVTVTDEFDYDLLQETVAPRVVTVAGVPAGAALPAAFATRLGAATTGMLETALGTPDRARLLNPAGLWLSARALRAMLADRQPRDPTLLGDFRYFLENCVHHDVRTGRVGLDALRDGDLMAALGRTAGGLTSIHRNAAGGGLVALSCPRAWEGHGAVVGLRTRIEREGVARKIASCQELRGVALALSVQELNRDRAAVRRQLADRRSACGDRVFTGALQAFGFAGGGMAEQFTALAAIGLFRQGVHLLSGSEPNAVALGSFAAARQRNATFVIAGELAAAALPALRGVLECVVLLLLPFTLVFALLFFERCGAYLANALVLVLWLQLWPPVMTVVNHIGEWMQVAALNKHVILGDGRFTAAGAAAALEDLDTQLALSRYMLVLVPMLAWALARTGEMGATMLASRFLQPGEAAASAAAANVAANNWRMDQVQLEPRTAAGPHVATVGDPWGGVATRYEEAATMALPANQPGYVGAASTRTVTEALSRRAEEARVHSAERREQFAEAVESAWSSAFGKEGTESLRALREEGVADVDSYRALQGYSDAASQGVAKSREIGQREGGAKERSVGYSGEASASVSMVLGAAFKGGVSLKEGTSVEVHDAMRRSYDEQSDAVKRSSEEVGAALERVGRSSLAASIGTAASESVQASLRQAASEHASWSSAEQSSERLAVASEVARTSGRSIVHDIAKDPRNEPLLREFHRLHGAEGRPFEEAWSEAQRVAGVELDLDELSRRLAAAGVEPVPERAGGGRSLAGEHADNRERVERTDVGEVAAPAQLEEAGARLRAKQEEVAGRQLPATGDEFYRQERRLDEVVRGADGELIMVAPNEAAAADSLLRRDSYLFNDMLGIETNNPLFGTPGLRGGPYTVDGADGEAQYGAWRPDVDVPAKER